METCFVIQPFDGGKFDKRYEDVFVPAIKRAGVNPYRVDRDPTVSIPIDEIEAGIKTAALCLADITTDNPNVWFELGYAIAAKRDVVLVCARERASPFPFDVQHRSIIRYLSESPRDFADLQAQVQARIEAILTRRESTGTLAQLGSGTTLEGLEPHEVAALVSVAEESDDLESGLSSFRVRQAMEVAGFTKLATTLGLRALLDLELLQPCVGREYNGEEFQAYRVTRKGMNWLHENRAKLALTQEGRARKSDSTEAGF